MPNILHRGFPRWDPHGKPGEKSELQQFKASVIKSIKH